MVKSKSEKIVYDALNAAANKLKVKRQGNVQWEIKVPNK